MPSKSCTHIKYRVQLFKENLQSIFEYTEFFTEVPEIEVICHVSNKANFSSFMVKFKGSNDIIYLVAKEYLHHWNHGIDCNILKPFLRECLLYEISQKCPELVQITPKCYHFSSTSYEEFCESITKSKIKKSWFPTKPPKPINKDSGLVLFEDLRPENGWRTLTRQDCSDLHVTKLIIEKMATFHGIMYQWLESQDETEQLLKRLKYPLYKENSIKLQWKMLKYVEDILKKSSKSKEFIKAFKCYRKYQIQHDFRSCLPRYSNFVTLILGNVQFEDILFNEQTSELKFSNFEAVQFAHPAQDFWTFIYTTTTSKWRNDYLDEIIFLYYQRISKYFGPSLFEDFKIEFYSKRAFGISWALYSLPFLLKNKNTKVNSIKRWKKLQKWKKKQFKKLNNRGNEEFKDTILEIIEKAHQLRLF